MGGSKIKEDPQGRIFEISGWPMGKNKSNEMRAVPFPIQFSISEERAEGLGTSIRNLHQYQISAILDRIIELLRKEGKDKDHGDLIYMKLGTGRRERDRERERESKRASVKCESCEPITKQWIFDLLDIHMSQSKGSFYLM